MNGVSGKKKDIVDVWMLSREYGELAGAGGVKDVVCQLAESLTNDSSMNVQVVLPLYGFVDAAKEGFSLLPSITNPDIPLEFSVDMHYVQEQRWESCRVWYAKLNGVHLYLIEAERFSDKGGIYVYTDDEQAGDEKKQAGSGHFDYFAMNVLLQKSALELMILLNSKPDVIHCHDGHTALVPALIHEWQGWRSYFQSCGCLVTIHNAGMGYHQEVGDLPFGAAVTGLPMSSITLSLLDGNFDPFMSAGRYCLLNTVSENYARELQETDDDGRTGWLGHALIEQGIRIEGITNGISMSDFNPKAEDSALAASFDPSDAEDDLSGKLACKRELLETEEPGRSDGLIKYGQLDSDEDQPLFAFIGRLSEQKGVDLLINAVEDLFGRTERGRLVILGSGTELLESRVIALANLEQYRGRICFYRGYDTRFAAKVYAASDFFVIPSRFEPCGLTDFIAQLYGSVPVVHHVGGLVKVIDGVTGLAYGEGSAMALTGAIERAILLYSDKKKLRNIRKQAVDNISDQYTWNRVGKKYLELYQRAKELRTIKGNYSQTPHL